MNELPQKPQSNIGAVITSFSSCPKCGGRSGYYILSRVSGIVQDNTDWNGRKENSNMNDSITYKTIHKYYKCIDCNKNIVINPFY